MGTHGLVRGLPWILEAQGGLALSCCTISSLGNAVQCWVVTIKIDEEREDLSPFGFTLGFFPFSARLSVPQTSETGQTKVENKKTAWLCPCTKF